MRNHGTSIENVFLSSTSVNSDPIRKEHITNLGSHLKVIKATIKFSISSTFSQDWKTIKYNSLARSWLPNSLTSWLTIGPVHYATISTIAFATGTSSQWLREHTIVIFMRSHGTSIENAFLPVTLINSDPIRREHKTTLGSHWKVKTITNFSISSTFFQDWKIVKYNSLVRSWLPNSLMSWLTISHVHCATVYINVITTGTSFWWPRPIIPQMRR